MSALAVLAILTTALAADPPAIDWQPWGSAAFETARRRDQPVMLYIADGWSRSCLRAQARVLQDPEVASTIGRHFIAIRIDRTHRPDLAMIYSSGVRALTRRDGWPLVAFLDPAGTSPFDGGVIDAPEALRVLLKQVLDRWARDRAQVDALAARAQAGILAGLWRQETEPRSVAGAGAGDVQRAAAQLLAGFDRRCGGFRRSRPREPRPAELRLLLETAWDDSAARVALLFTLDRLGMGGIFDQIGGGFHRDTTDACWTLPRFEKTLAVNAQLASVYAKAHERTGDPFYADRARATLDWALRELAAPAGGFWSARTSETAGREGGHYLWGPGEAEAALDRSGLGVESTRVATSLYGLAEPRFREPDRPDQAGPMIVLRLAARPDDAAARMGLSQEEFDRVKESIDGSLRAARARRPLPAADEQIVTGFNGLMIAALAEGSRALAEPRYLEAAARAAAFAVASLRRADGSLARSFRGGSAQGEGLLEDYALLIHGLLALGQATGEAAWTEHANALEVSARDRFRDPASGGFFDAPAGGPTLPVRTMTVEDGEVPAGNGVMLGNLLELHERSGDRRYLDDAVALAWATSAGITRNPAGTAWATVALDRLLREHPQALAEPMGSAPAPERAVLLSVSAPAVTVTRDEPARFELTLQIAPGSCVVAHDPGTSEASGAIGLELELVSRGLDLEVAYPPGDPAPVSAPATAIRCHAGSVTIPVMIARDAAATEAGPGRPRLVLRCQVSTGSGLSPVLRLLVPIEITCR